MAAPTPSLLPYVIKYNATKPTKFASFPKYKEYVADERYAKIARRVGLCSADTPISEAVDCLVKAIRELMTVTERPLCIKDCGVSEAEFMSKVDELSYKAFEDQCTTANPVYPHGVRNQGAVQGSLLRRISAAQN